MVKQLRAVLGGLRMMWVWCSVGFRRSLGAMVEEGMSNKGATCKASWMSVPVGECLGPIGPFLCSCLPLEILLKELMG